MTEAEWWASTGSREWPHRLFHWLSATLATDRKLRLACVACCRLVEPFAGGAPFPYLLRLLEEFADGKEDYERVERAVSSIGASHSQRYQSLQVADGHPTLTEHVELRVQAAILATGSPFRDREWHNSRKSYPYPSYVAEDVIGAASLLEQQNDTERHIVRLLHDIFGPLPFRDVAISPAWRTSDVLALARGIYEEKAFDRMSILADALQDAGCDNDEILTHCRAAGWEHVRGCWVVDLLLGKPWREGDATPG